MREVAELELGKRYIRDFEIVALSKVLEVSLDSLLLTDGESEKNLQ